MEFVERSAAVSLASPRPAATRSDARAVALWLLACCALVFAMVVVGGATRLTHSGLSITEWDPIVGTLPPLDAKAWNEAFLKYQATPEYVQVNRGMSLAAFKAIFWWEYAHRLLGRAIGVVFLLPLVGFMLRRRLPAGLGPRLFAIFALGGLQGALGWYMVQSGLVDDPRVSPIRLALHLGLAFLIFGAMLWTALSLLRPRALPDDKRTASLRRFAWTLVGLVFAMVLAGGLVAGLRAGFAYNTFPLMAGALVPREVMMLDPWYLNVVNNIATVQFDHRAIAWILIFAVPAFRWRVARTGRAPLVVRRSASLLLLLLALQVALGIATLLLIVPLPLAAAHQAGALLVFAAALNMAHTLRAGGKPDARIQTNNV